MDGLFQIIPLRASPTMLYFLLSNNALFFTLSLYICIEILGQKSHSNSYIFSSQK